MADYEVLEPGGHELLVGKIKQYADRPGSVGTNQLVNDAVTDAKLAQSGGILDRVRSIDSSQADIYEMLGVGYARFESGYFDITAVGSTIDIGARLASASYSSAAMRVVGGSGVIVKGIVGGGSQTAGAKAWAVLDDDFEVLARSGNSATLNNKVIHIPEGGAYLLLNTSTPQSASVETHVGLMDGVKGIFSQQSLTISDFSVYERVKATITSTKVWATGDSYNSCFIPLPEGYDKTVTVQANANESSLVSFLTSDTVGSMSSSVSTFASGEDERHTVSAGSTETFHVGADCRFILVVRVSSSTTLTPQSLSATTMVSDTERNATLIDALGDRVDATNVRFGASDGQVDAIAKALGLAVARFESGDFDITAVGTTIDITTRNPGSTFRSAVVAVEGGIGVLVTNIVGGGTETAGARAYAVLDDDFEVLARSGIGVTYDNNVIRIPDGGRYLLLNTQSSSQPTVTMSYGVEGGTADLFRRASGYVSDFASLTGVSATIAGLNKWYTGSSYDSCFVAIPTGHTKTVTVKANEDNGSIVTFLTSDKVGASSSNVTTLASGEAERHVLSAGATETFKVGADCRFAFVVRTSSGTSYVPQRIEYALMESDTWRNTERIEALEDAIGQQGRQAGPTPEQVVTRAIASDSNGHDVPQATGVYNAYKRAHQMLDVEWDALSPVPHSTSPTAIVAGEHTGLPYSSVKEYDKFVGWNVSLKSFMTAAHNPYSLLYTEDVLGSRSTSEYGITYHGTNCGAYFGIVCNNFALYSLGFSVPWNTAEFHYLHDIGVLGKPYDQSASGMRLMDVVWEPGHANIITDIERDEHGRPTYIYWSESTGLFPRTNKYTPEQVNARLSDRGGIIYYSTDLYKNLDYEPSPFVAVGDEAPQEYEYNDDICTFAGDYACFNGSEDVWINYTAGSYDTLELYKGDTLLSETAISSSAHKVQVTTDGAGLYKARLTNGSESSEFTHFEIVDTSVAAAYDGTSLTTSFSSSNGSPLYLQLTYRSGSSRGIYELTSEDIVRGVVTIDPAAMLAEQYPGESFAETTYVKVFFAGQYGVVPNAYLDSGIVS